MPGLHVPGYAAVQKLRDGRRVRTAIYRHVYHSVRPALYLGNDGVRLGVQRALVAHGLALPGKGLRVLFQHTVVDLVYLDRASVVVCGRKQAAAPQVQVRAGQPPVGCNAPGPARQLLAVSPAHLHPQLVRTGRLVKYSYNIFTTEEKQQNSTIEVMSMKEKLPGLFRPLMKFNVTAVMVIILMFSVFNVFSIVRTQQRQASLQTMALSQASQQIGDFIASAEQLGIVVQNDSQLMAYNLYNNRDLPHNIVWELEMLAPSVNSLSSLSIVYVDSLYPQINGVIYSSAGRFSYADYCRDELSGSLTENQLMEVVYAADHAHFVPQLSGNTRSLLYVMPIPSSYVFSPGRLLLRLDYTSFTRGLRATAAGNSDIYVFDSEENLLLYFGPTYGNDITAARAAAVGPESLSGKAVFRHELENYGIQVVQALDFWQYYQPTLTAVLSLVLLAAFVTVSGLRLSYVLAQNTARPFSVLVQRASQLGGVTPAEEPDEIARLSHIFEDLVEQQTSLTAAMESHSQLEESQYLLYLLGVLGGRDFSGNRRTEIQYAAFPLEPLRPARPGVPL